MFFAGMSENYLKKRPDSLRGKNIHTLLSGEFEENIYWTAVGGKGPAYNLNGRPSTPGGEGHVTTAESVRYGGGKNPVSRRAGRLKTSFEIR